MAEVTLFTSPMARKKRVEERYQPNSYRVISQEAEKYDRPARLSTYTTTVDFNVLGQKAEPFVPFLEHRKNRPNPNHVGFLRQDVRLLNDPVCDVHTESTKQEQVSWWPSRVSEEPHKNPAHTLDTTVRGDFQYRGKGMSLNGRHTANPNKVPAQGTIPVNWLRDKSGKQRFWKEGISYEHQYNSRLEPQYPPRGKRQGNFVWDQFQPQEVDRMLHHYEVVADKQQQTSNKNDQVSSEKSGQEIPSPAYPKSATVPKTCKEENHPVNPSQSAHSSVRKASECAQNNKSRKTGEQSGKQSPPQSAGVKLPPIVL